MASKEPSTPSSLVRTILRVKRRRSQSPLAHIALESPSHHGPTSSSNPALQAKRRKRDFSLAGSVASAKVEAEPEEDVLKKLTSAAKEKVKADLRADPKGAGSTLDKIKSELRSNRSSRASAKRFKVLESHRTISLDDEDKVTLYDLVKEDAAPDAIACNGVEMTREKVEKVNEAEKAEDGEEDYVYDYYYSEMVGKGEKSDEADAADDGFFDHIASIQAYGVDTVDLMMDEYRDRDEDAFADSDDSNAEDNWRNDYPEEEEYAEFAYDSERDRGDDESSEGDFDFDKMNLKGEDSSDDEEGLVYSRSTAEDDANRHGSSYAKYKQRVMKDLYQDEAADDDIDDLDEYY